MPAKARILIVDDEPNLRRILAAVLLRDGYEVRQAADGAQALEHLGEVDAVVTDLKMPRMDGMALLRRAVVDAPGVPIIVLTAHGSVDSAVEAVKLGAFDYLEKPFEQGQVREVVAKAVRQSEAERHSPRLQLEPDGRAAKGRFGLIGESAAMRQIYAIIEKVADTPSTVLVTGESGTGKELIAKALHQQSARRDAPFIKINCAAIPKTLMESELFGYEKGAFTGAVSSKPGRFELADKGTLFLDEIGEIPPEMQVKLLRALQESEFERVGGLKTIKVDVRLITATNRDLEREIRAGNFREDLYYRLAVVPIHLPPLRDRRDDLPLLVEHILHKFNERLNKRVEGVAADALARLMAHAWPGNIRELENVLERTLLFCDEPVIRACDLPPDLGAAPIVALPAGAESARTMAAGIPEAVRTDASEPARLTGALAPTDPGIATPALPPPPATQAPGTQGAAGVPAPTMAPASAPPASAAPASASDPLPRSAPTSASPTSGVPAVPALVGSASGAPDVAPIGHPGQDTPSAPATGPVVTSLKDLVRQETERVERLAIVRALEETGGNVTQAAKRLKISRKSLQLKMKEFGLRERE